MARTAHVRNVHDNGRPRPLTFNQELVLQQREFVANALLRRMDLYRSMLDPRRNINHECGFPETSELTVDMYRQMYDREAVAARVVEVLPEETWKCQPEVYEDEDMDVETPFEAAWKAMTLALRGERSWYKDEEGSPLWDALLRVDIMCGIGHYGVLLMGLSDGKPLHEEAVPADGLRLLFLRSFDESLAQVTQCETDEKDPRFGLPARYLLTFSDPKDPHAVQGVGNQTAEVHWSRVIHVVDDRRGSVWCGVPRMRPVFNNLHGLQKLYAGSPEMYWRGAFPGLSLETMPEMIDADRQVDTSTVRDAMEQYMNGLQRYFALTGMTAKTLAPQVVDPTAQVEVQLDALCIKLAVPKRIFMGSERGELASSQDEDAWNDRLAARQRNHVTPNLIVPLVDRLITLRVLPEPEEFHVEWPDLSQLTEGERADIAVKRTEAMSKYVQGGVDGLIEPQNYLTKVVGFTEDEAEEIAEATAQHVEEGGMAEPPPTDEELAMQELDLEAKRKQVDQIGKPQPAVAVVAKGGKPDAFGKTE